MLPKERRLTSDYNFKTIRQGGKKISTPFFNLYYLWTKKGTPSRFGFVVSTRLDKRAVKRNRVKRIFREQTRLLLPRIKDGFDLAFWVRRKSMGMESDQVQMAIETALKKGGLLANA